VNNPIIVALDLPDPDDAATLATQLAPHVGAFKIGKELFTTAGPDIVRRIRDLGASVFLDLKFHDIPNTVAKAVTAAARLDVQMLTVHTSGGTAMLKAAAEAAGENGPLILGVTVLTSMDETDLYEVGIQKLPAAQVQHLATLATTAGLRGLVCSPKEIAPLRETFPAEIQLITPGIRPAGTAAGDQKRIMPPAEAIAAGANHLVIGRPITAAKNPAGAAQAIAESITAG